MSPLIAVVPVAVLVDLAMKSLAVMLTALLAGAMVRRASAAWRHLVWSLGVAALLLMPVLSIALPAWRVSWLPGLSETASIVADNSPSSRMVADAATTPRTTEAGVTPAAVVGSQGAIDQPVSRPAPQSAAIAAHPAIRFDWHSLGFPAWLLGAVVAISPLAVGLWQLRRLRRGSTPVTGVGWLALLDALRHQLGVRQQVWLQRSSQATMPLTWGVLRPVLLVPAEADEWSPERRRMVLLHELAHIRRNDWLTQMLAHAACAIYWFNPLVWLAARQMRIERERACDDLVLASGAKASDYAQELLTLAAGLADPRLATLVAVPMARRSVLEDRLRAILDGGRSRAALTTAAVLLACALVGAAVAPLAMLRAAQPKPLESAKPAAPQPLAEPAEPKEAPKPTAEAPVNKTVNIRGKVVDDETGKPIERLITQAGKFDPADPTKVTWGYSEGRSSAKDGSFSTTVRWTEGWTARILADGYVPQPVITSAPPADKDEIMVTLRLKRGRLVRGEVLDHAGKPVKGAAVFAVGPTGLNLSAGQAWTSWGEEDNEAKPVVTDDAGRFELPAGEAKTVAVSHAGFDAWPAAIPAAGSMKIILPQPARVDIELNIDGVDKESKAFYQLLSHLTPEFAGLQSTRELPIANGGKLSLPALPPGKYQICRQVMNRLAEIGTGAMLDREFFEIKAGETKTIRWVRDKGARLRGKVTWPAGAALAGIAVAVKAEKAEKDPFEGHEWQTTYASQSAAADGAYLTERIAPGSYLLVAEAFKPLTPEQRFSTGVVGPAFRAEMKVEVPVEGELKVPDLVLKEVRR